MLRRLTAFVFALAFAAACGPDERPAASAPRSNEASERPREGGTLLRRIESDIATLNPVLATSRYDRLVDFYLFTPLVHLDENLRPIAGLAEAWQISEDGREYTFKLNPRATFSDGTPVRASDVLFTLRKITDPATEAVQIAGGFETVDLVKTRVVDDRTIVIAVREAMASQLVRFNDLLVVPEAVYSKGNFQDDFVSTAVGSGPYKLVRREPGKEIVLERRSDYWGSKPPIHRVVFKVIVDANTAWQAVKRGDIDETTISSDLWVRESRSAQNLRRLDFRRFYALNTNFIAWNGRNSILSDARVRRAAAMCIDLPTIINRLYHGTARAMSGPFTPDLWAFNPAVPVTPFDPEEAKRVLASADWKDTNGDGFLDRRGKPLTIELMIMSGSATGPAFAQLFQEELRRIGVTLNIAVLDPATAIRRILAGNYQAAYLGWDLDPDPDPFAYLHSSQSPPRGQNFAFYSRPEVDRLIEQGRRQLDFGERVKTYQRLHEIVAADQPYTWTIQVSQKWAINKRVRGVRESKGYGLSLWYPGELDWWLADGK